MFNRSKNSTIEDTKTEQRQTHLLPGVGPRVQGSPFGWLHFERLPNAVAAAERELLQFDREQVAEMGGPPAVLIRPAAEVEKALLRHCGFQVPDNLETECRAIAFQSQQPGVGIMHSVEFCRRWPALEGQPAKELPTLPQVQVRYGLTAAEVAREVGKVHQDAVSKIRTALDQGDLDTARDWCDALDAHCQHPIVDAG